MCIRNENGLIYYILFIIILSLHSSSITFEFLVTKLSHHTEICPGFYPEREPSMF